MLEHVLAERIDNDRVALEALDGFQQVARQAVDAVVLALLLGHGEDVFGDLARRGHVMLDTVDARRKARRNRQIRVARGVRTAQLHARGAASCRRNTDQGRAVRRAPRKVTGRFIARHKALIGIDERIGDRRHAAHMAQQSRDKAVRLPGKLLHSVRIEKDILPVLKQRHIRMHAAAVDAVDRLRHERGMEAAHLRNRLDRHAERHDIVRRAEGVGIAEVDFVLSLGNLVVARLDLEPELLEHQADLAPHVPAAVDGRHIEVPRRIRGARRGTALVVRLKQEKLHLRPDVERIAEGLRLFQRLFQNIARVADKRRAVRIIHVADHARGLARMRLPRQHGERVQIGTQILVGLMDAREALDGAAVDRTFVVHGLFDLRPRDRDVLELPENVGKLQTDKFDVLFVDDADDVVLRVMLHDAPLSIFVSVPRKRKGAHPYGHARPRMNAGRSTVAFLFEAFACFPSGPAGRRFRVILHTFSIPTRRTGVKKKGVWII